MTDFSTLERPGRPKTATRRRFRRRAPDRRLSYLTEGRVSSTVLGREARYRRGLIAADMVATLFALAAVTWLTDAEAPVPALILAPLGVMLASKLAGLYDRDALVLRKTTLDEAPAMLQITA